MAIDANGARFLLWSKRRGVNFGRTATLGRLAMLLSDKEIAALLRQFGVRLTNPEALVGTAEPFLKLLGASTVDSLDIDPQDEPTHLQDLNVPIPDSLREQYDLVVDGGTLEHVFNLPVALRNLMEMVRVGGHALSITVANNCCGHGFYQFSPGLFFKVFSKENGFELEAVILTGTAPGSPWFYVRSPWEVPPVEYLKGARTYVLVLARRVEVVPIFKKFPHQELREMHWAMHDEIQEPAGPPSSDMVAPRV